MNSSWRFAFQGLTVRHCHVMTARSGPGSPPHPPRTRRLMTTRSSLVAQEVHDSLPRNWVDVAWRTTPVEVLRGTPGSVYCFSQFADRVLSGGSGEQIRSNPSAAVCRAYPILGYCGFFSQ